MSVAGLLRHRCDVERMQPFGTNGAKTMQSVATGVPCLFLPMSGQAAVENGYSVGYGWNVYAKDGANIKTGDRLTWNAKTYIVKGVMPFTGVSPGVNHSSYVVTTEKSNGQ